MPVRTYTFEQAQQYPHEVLVGLYNDPDVNSAPLALCALLALSPTGRASEIKWLNQDMLTAVVTVANRTELNRVGRALVTTARTPDADFFTAALAKAATGAGGKTFALALLARIKKEGYLATSATTCAETLGATLTRALGSQTFVAGVRHMSDTTDVEVVAATASALGLIGPEEEDAIAQADFHSPHVSPSALVRNIAAHPPESFNSWQSHAEVLLKKTSAEIVDGTLQVNLAALANTVDTYMVIAPHNGYSCADAPLWACAPSLYHTSGGFLNAPLRLLTEGLSRPRLSAAFSLWNGTQTSPSPQMAAAALSTNIDLLGLVLAGPTDGSGDEMLVAAAEKILPPKFDTSRHLCGSATTCRPAAARRRILATVPLSNPALLTYFLSGSVELFSEYLLGCFAPNPPDASLARRVAPTISPLLLAITLANTWSEEVDQTLLGEALADVPGLASELWTYSGSYISRNYVSPYCMQQWRWLFGAAVDDQVLLDRYIQRLHTLFAQRNIQRVPAVDATAVQLREML